MRLLILGCRLRCVICSCFSLDAYFGMFVVVCLVLHVVRCWLFFARVRCILCCWLFVVVVLCMLCVFVVCCLSVVGCLPFHVCGSLLLVVRCLLLVVRGHSLIVAVCCSLSVYSLFFLLVVFCLFFSICRLVSVVCCCLLVVVRCVLFDVVCYLLFDTC